MPAKIRTKLITAFIGLISVTLGITIGLYYYTQSNIQRSIRIFTEISEEMTAVHRLQLTLYRAIMPGNDYIITGNNRYMEEFGKASEDMEVLLGILDDTQNRLEHEVSVEMEERRILGDVKAAWVNIKDITLKIFSIPEPVGSMEALTLMEEMDYRWGSPAIEKLRQWSEIESRLHEEVRKDIERTQRWSWLIIGLGTLFLFTSGVSFSILYSQFFVEPIKVLHRAAGAIAGGDFENPIYIKTGDEVEALANAMNDMAARLQIAHSSLESQVEIRTEELQATNKEMVVANEELQAAYSQLATITTELEKANKESNELDKLKIEFLQSISHELRSPLTPILGYLEMMKDGDIGELTPKQKEVVEEIYLCGKNMQMIVDELLEVATIQAGKLSLEFDDVDLQAVLLQAVKGIRKYADDQHIQVETRFPPDPLWIVGDKHSLAEIFTHLVRNAVKFNREKGKVKVEVKVKDNGFEIAVTDTGIGIPNDRLDRIYDAFYQVDSSSSRSYEGVGLGLYLVKRLVDIHNGAIEVQSKEGSGTTLTVFIPQNRQVRRVRRERP